MKTRVVSRRTWPNGRSEHLIETDRGIVIVRAKDWRTAVAWWLQFLAGVALGLAIWMLVFG